MTRIEDAARTLAAAEEARLIAELRMQATEVAREEASAMHWQAAKRVEEALMALVDVTRVSVSVPDRIVKRPTTQSTELLGLDDIDGR